VKLFNREHNLYHKGEVPENIKKSNDKVGGIFYRGNYYEVHFANRVEFRTLNNRIIGWSEIEVVK